MVRDVLGYLSEKVAQSCPTLCNPMDYTQSREFSRSEYWSDSFSLLQGIFPTQGWNSDLPHCRQILVPAELSGKTRLGMRGYVRKWSIIYHLDSNWKIFVILL